MRPTAHYREIDDRVATILAGLGVYLLVFGLIGAAWAARSGLAQARYAAILFGRQDAENELRLARRAFRLDPHLYALCIRAAETAFTASEAAADPAQAESFRKEAAYWVGRGLNLNPWLMELRYLEARLLGRESPAAAVEAWKAYVDWHFWDPQNLEQLARFQEAAGQDADALETLDYFRLDPGYNDWRNAIRARLEGGVPAPPAP